MAYTDSLSPQAGVVYDVNENARLTDYANQFNTLTQQSDSASAKKSNTVRYLIIGFGSLLVLAILRIAVKSK